MLSLAVLIGVLLLLIVVGMPISLAIILSSTAIFWAHGISTDTIPIRMFNGIMKHDLLAVPIFIVMGTILAESGLSNRLVALANSLVGFMRGGLAMANVVTGMFLAEMSGAGTADAAILSKIFVQDMGRRGYDRGFSAAVTSAAGSLGIIIPPSIPMVILGLYTNISVAQLFLAGFIPGLIMVVFELAVCYAVARAKRYPIAGSFSLRLVWQRFLEAWYALLIPVIILGAIFTGLATVTEASELGLFAVVVGGVLYGKLGVRELYRLVGQGLRQSAVILLIITASTLISWVFANERVAPKVVDAIATAALPRWVVLLLINLFIIILGTFLHGTATIIIVAPLLLPLALSLGLHPLQYGIIITLGQAIGQQTPPVASVLLTVASVSRIPLEEILPWLGLFLIAFVAVLLIATFVPWVSLFIPQLLAVG